MEAIKIGSMEVLTKRPEGMKFEEYKRKRYELKQALKKRLKGTMLYLSSYLYVDEATKIQMKKTNKPYVRSVMGQLPRVIIE